MITSIQIAKVFNKDHKNVLSNIRVFKENNPELSGLMDEYFTNKQNRKYPMFALTGEFEKAYLSKMEGHNRIPFGLKEKVSLETIEQLLNVKLVRQYAVGNYRIDGYEPISNTAYEIDEPAHDNKKQKDADREAFIKSQIGCKFVRIKVS